MFQCVIVLQEKFGVLELLDRYQILTRLKFKMY